MSKEQLNQSIDSLSETIKTLFAEVNAFIEQDNEQHGTPDFESRRWKAIAQTEIQKGLLALRKSINNPKDF